MDRERRVEGRIKASLRKIQWNKYRDQKVIVKPIIFSLNLKKINYEETETKEGCEWSQYCEKKLFFLKIY